MVAEAGKGWVLAPSLVALIDQIDAAFPGRNTVSDGSIGDSSHASQRSDHNPNGGYVDALDVTHDVNAGFDSYAFAETLRHRRDPRIKYVISNDRMFSSYDPGSAGEAWEWRDYGGINPHSRHVHVSVNPHAASRNNTAPWFDGAAPSIPSSPSAHDVLRVGSKGDAVRDWQTLLHHAGLLAADGIDGDFGPITEGATREFQARLDVEADGIVGPQTRAATDRFLAFIAAVNGQSTGSPGVPPFPGQTRRGVHGDAVIWLQVRLRDRGWRIRVDGHFGPQTEQVVRAFQAEKGLDNDGIVGPVTWDALWTLPVS